MSGEKLSYTWMEMESMSMNQLVNIFVNEIPNAKNLIITHMLGNKPLDYLPEEIVQKIHDMLPVYNQGIFKRTCYKYYSYYLNATKLREIANSDFSSRKKIIFSWSDEEIFWATKIILNIQLGINQIELLACIYHITCDRKWWPNAFKGGFNCSLFPANHYIKPLCTYPTFGKFVNEYARSWCPVYSEIAYSLVRDKFITNIEFTSIELKTIHDNCVEIDGHEHGMAVLFKDKQ